MPSDDAYLSESDDPDVYDADPDALPHPSGAGAGTSSAFAGGEGSSGAAGHAVPGGAAGTSARHGSGGPPSSGGNNAGDDDGVNKKRKIQRACDICRRRKQRCNGAEMPNNCCSSCIAGELACTYNESSKKRAPPKGYVESLESRLRQTEEMIAKLRPDVDLTAALGDPLDRSSFPSRRRSGKPHDGYGPSGPIPASAPPMFPGYPTQDPHQQQQWQRQHVHPQSSYPTHSQYTHTQAQPGYLPPPPPPPPPPDHHHQSRPGPHQPSTTFYPPRQQPPYDPGAPSSSTNTYPGYPRSGSYSGSPSDAGHRSHGASPSGAVGPLQTSQSGSPAIVNDGSQPHTYYTHQQGSLSGDLPRPYSSGGPPPFRPGEGPDEIQLPAHHDDESDLKNFVQLNHRDEQLFKRFMGKSSGLPLLFSALGFKYGAYPNRYGQEIKLLRTTSRSRFWRIPPWESTPGVTPTSSASPNPQLQAMLSSNPFASWPNPDLAARLIDCYFGRVNSILPLLHRPTFNKQYESQLYQSDPGFARACLLIFAVGSTYCDDPAVLFPREEGGTFGIDSAGWVFYHAFGRMVRHRLAPTELWDLQVSVLLVQFLRHSSQPGACWNIVGEGLRYAQDVGVHRSGIKRSADEVENELFRRGFWCLYMLDREFSAFMGRPLTLSDDDFDVGFPFDCDEPYWQTGDPETSFKQPIEVPSRTTAFILNIQLAQILSSAVVQLYTIKPPHLRQTPPSEIVADLNAQLAAWLASVPPHLIFDPQRPVDLFFRQSADLALQYQMVTTYVHRPFLPSPQNPAPTSSSSFIKCLNAANQAAHVMDVHLTRTGSTIPNVFHGAYTAGLILLIGVWSDKATGLVSDPSIAMQGVQQTIRSLTEGERRFFGIGRARDAITVLSQPRGEYGQTKPNKRQRSDKIVPRPLQSPLEKGGGGGDPHPLQPIDTSSSEMVRPSSASSSPGFSQQLQQGNGNGQRYAHLQQSHLQGDRLSPQSPTYPFPSGQGPTGRPGTTTSPYSGASHVSPNSSSQTPPEFLTDGAMSETFMGSFPDWGGEQDPSYSLFPTGDDYYFFTPQGDTPMAPAPEMATTEEVRRGGDGGCGSTIVAGSTDGREWGQG